MGRNARMVMTLEEWKRWAKESKPLDFDVMYSDKLNRIILSDRGRVVNVCGEKGIMFTKHGYVGSSFVKIGRLI